jgi:hypothetical protein
LTPDEEQLLMELLQIAQGMAQAGDLKYLNSEQKALLPNLSAKRYVRAGKYKFRVLFPP